MSDTRIRFVATIADSDAPASTEHVYGYVDQYMEERVLTLARPARRVHFRFPGAEMDACSCDVAAYRRGDYHLAWFDANGRPA